MAKQYDFSFNAHEAEFKDGFVSVAYNLRFGPIACESKTCTLAEALEHLSDFSSRTKAPHAAMLSMRNPDDRKPPSFKAAKTTIYREV